MNETPQVINACYASNTYAGDLVRLSKTVPDHFQEKGRAKAAVKRHDIEYDIEAALRKLHVGGGEVPVEAQKKIKGDEDMKRVVKVYVADPHKDVPLKDSLLYSGEEKMTDLTDQELFYEINIKEILDKHNEARVKMLDKDASKKAGKDIFLEPAKIRELVMTVVDVAVFSK